MKPFVFRTLVASAFAAALAGGALAAASQSPARQAILDRYAAEVRQSDPGFHGFSADAGRAFFAAHPGTGNPQPGGSVVRGCPTEGRAGKELAGTCRRVKERRWRP